jgi:hypothetical protein
MRTFRGNSFSSLFDGLFCVLDRGVSGFAPNFSFAAVEAASAVLFNVFLSLTGGS